MGNVSSPLTFSQRRRVATISDPQILAVLNLEPQQEYDMNTQNQISNSASQRSEIFRHFKKPKISRKCPVCAKDEFVDLWRHLSQQHPHNCDKQFHHQANSVIQPDGTVIEMEVTEPGTTVPLCATLLSDDGYAVCLDFLRSSDESTNDRICTDSKYKRSPFIGCNGMLIPTYCQLKPLDQVQTASKIPIPTQEMIEVLAENFDQEMYTSKMSLKSHGLEIVDPFKSPRPSFYQIAQLSSQAIRKAIRRLENSSLVLQSRRTLVELMKLIYQRDTAEECDHFLEELIDHNVEFVEKIIKLVEKRKIVIEVNKEQNGNHVEQELRKVPFTTADFLALLLRRLKLTTSTNQTAKLFLNRFLKSLTELVVSSEAQLQLEQPCDSGAMAAPSHMVVELLAPLALAVLNQAAQATISGSDSYHMELHGLLNTLSGGVLRPARSARFRHWCLRQLLVLLDSMRSWAALCHSQRIHREQTSSPALLADFTGDLTGFWTSSLEIVNCHTALQQMCLFQNSSTLLTADKEGTLRIWGVDSVSDIEAGRCMRQTFLFCPTPLTASLADDAIKSRRIEDLCVGPVSSSLPGELTVHLLESGLQRVAVGRRYIAEAVGVVINIWSVLSTRGRPYVTSMPSLVTVLQFPRHCRCGGLLGAPVELLLVGTADGCAWVLRIWDNGTRVTHNTIRLPGSEPLASITAASWWCDSDPLVLGYHTGSLVLACAPGEAALDACSAVLAPERLTRRQRRRSEEQTRFDEESLSKVQSEPSLHSHSLSYTTVASSNGSCSEHDLLVLSEIEDEEAEDDTPRTDLTSDSSNCVTLAPLHSSRIVRVVHCPYFDHNTWQTYFLSMATDDDRVGVWHGYQPVCVFSLATLDDSHHSDKPNVVSCVEWCPLTALSSWGHGCDLDKNDCGLIMIGDSQGRVSIVRFQHGGADLQRMQLLTGGHRAAVSCLRLSPEHQLLVSGCVGGWLAVWGLSQAGTLVASELHPERGPVLALEWVTGGSAVAVCWARSGGASQLWLYRCRPESSAGLWQWARLRQTVLGAGDCCDLSPGRSSASPAPSMMHLRFLAMDLAAHMHQLRKKEHGSVQSGKSLVHSAWLQLLVELCSADADLVSTFVSQCSNETVKYSEKEKDEDCPRAQLLHRISCGAARLQGQQQRSLAWLADVYRLQRLTHLLTCTVQSNDDRVGSQEDLVPGWWWLWCAGSVESTVRLRKANSTSKASWTRIEQSQLMQWYREDPLSWLGHEQAHLFGWGSNSAGQLGDNDAGRRESDLTMSAFGSVVCGTDVTLVVASVGSSRESRRSSSEDNVGSLLASGQGVMLLFNPYMQETLTNFVPVPVISDLRVSHVSASCGPDTHILAITIHGTAYSWGRGNHGKLGHGYETTIKRPKLIEALANKSIIQVACGHDHSAAVTACGRLYTFGLGSSGQLGLCLGSDSHRGLPILVHFGGDKDDEDDDENSNSHVKIGAVACGMNHTIALCQNGRSMFAFGEGQYGKLGTACFEDSRLPTTIDHLSEELVKVVAGRYASAALSREGRVWSWGHGSYCGLEIGDVSEVGVQHVLVPTLVPLPPGTGAVVDLTCGDDLFLVLTTTGTVIGWGCNSHDRLRLGSDHPVTAAAGIVQTPVVVRLLPPATGGRWRQVSCGPTHAALSACCPSHLRAVALAGGPQLCLQPRDDQDVICARQGERYPALLQRHSHLDMVARLALILYWNELLRLHWPLCLPLSHHCTVGGRSTDWPMVNNENNLYPALNTRLRQEMSAALRNADGAVRDIIDRPLLACVLQRHIQASLTTVGVSYSAIVSIDRIDSATSVFRQTLHTIAQIPPRAMRLPWRAWKVHLINEGADDAGGAYDETMSQMVDELLAGEAGVLLTPAPEVPLLLGVRPGLGEELRMLGLMMAVAVRTAKPIALNHISPTVWRLLVGTKIDQALLVDTDVAYIRSLADLEHDSETYDLADFTCHSADGSLCESVFGGAGREVRAGASLAAYSRCSLRHRAVELQQAAELVRDGMRMLLPLPLIDLLPWHLLEQLVCGCPCVPVAMLRNIARFAETTTQNSNVVQWLWEILERFTETEKSQFLRFVTGRSRLPSDGRQIPFRLFICLSNKSWQHLPQAQTCFNQLRLPIYRSAEEMEARLRQALVQCRSIDLDEYMLGGPNNANQTMGLVIFD